MDSVKAIIQSLLACCENLRQPQQKFLVTLFSTLFLTCGKANFTNLSRYSHISERTYRRQYQRSFNFIKFNQQLINRAIKPESEIILAVDCSFIPKSGHQTYGMDYFYNGSVSKAEKGLEISAMAVVDVHRKIAYSLSVQQTPAKSPSSDPSQQPETTRINYYLTQLEATVPYLPSSLGYVVTDGFYSKLKWVNGVTDLKLEAISKLRRDANLRYLYQGEYSGRGRPRKYAGKVDLTDYSNFELFTQISDALTLYTAVVWSVSLKRPIRICYLLNNSGSDCSYAVLYCTDVKLNPYSIYLYYKARFQIEFIFRDSKQFTGLADCQARDLTKLDFHFNSSLAALNLAKWDAVRQDNGERDFVFSMASYKRRALNYHLLERFIDKLDLDPTLIKSHPNYSNLCDYGAIAA
ncbi:transposase family protein [Xenococcus sp. PCC 7305]|nr:transposase family protein [Xenococcus sp. PCC 7305]